MSPVSPEFRTEATVTMGLKNVLRVGTSILYYNSFELLNSLLHHISIIPQTGTPPIITGKDTGITGLVFMNVRWHV